MSDRLPNAGHCTYPGDARGNVGVIMGPNTLGEMLTVVEETYDPESNRTRTGFDYSRPEDWERYGVQVPSA